jgi:DNA-binding HxlR family transcriptional regulator
MVSMAASSAPLVDALRRVGDRWSLLVIDALMESPLRFNDLARSVEGIAPNVLSDRLRRLERAGVVTAEPYSQRPLRHEYRLTEDGQELAGVIRLLSSWGSGSGAADAGLHHDACGTPIEARWYCPTCERFVEDVGGLDLRHL